MPVRKTNDNTNKHNKLRDKIKKDIKREAEKRLKALAESEQWRRKLKI